MQPRNDDESTSLFTLIRHGEVFAPEALGSQSILLCDGLIVRIGTVGAAVLRALDLGCQEVDATGCVVFPGLVDPHEHLIGAAGEQGFSSRQPEVPFAELVRAGITTVVGCLGADTTTRHLGTLLGKVRQLDEQGLTAYLYTGGFPVPPPTLTAAVMSDLILIDKVIGVGEIAISDVRSSQPSLVELARLVAGAWVGGAVSGKAGVTHFHVGPGRERLAPLQQLLSQYEVVPAAIYPTHVNRTAALLDEAIALAHRGAYIDIDTVDEDLEKWLRYYQDAGGPLGHLTVSSDAHTETGTPAKLYGQLVACCRDHEHPLPEVLPLFTSNPAAVLKLGNKGRLRPHAAADLVVASRTSLEIVHVFAKGRQVVRDGQVVTTLAR